MNSRQCLVLEHGLGERADRTWSAFEVAFQVARQNGKGETLLARGLAALFLLDERRATMIVNHTTGNEQFEIARRSPI